MNKYYHDEKYGINSLHILPYSRKEAVYDVETRVIIMVPQSSTGCQVNHIKSYQGEPYSLNYIAHTIFMTKQK